MAYTSIFFKLLW